MPSLGSEFRLHVVYVVSQDLIFGAESFQHTGHLYPSISDFPLLSLPKDFESFSLFMCLHLLGLSPVSLYGLLQLYPPCIHFLNDITICAYPPPGERLRDDICFDHFEQRIHDPFSIRLQEPFPSHEPYPAEDLHPELLPRDGPNYIDSILLLLDVLGPHTEYVPAFVHVHVVLHTTDVRRECFSVVGLHLLFLLNRVAQLPLEVLDLG